MISLKNHWFYDDSFAQSLIIPWFLWKIIDFCMISLKNHWFFHDFFDKSLIFLWFLWKIIDSFMISLQNHWSFHDFFEKSLIFLRFLCKIITNQLHHNLRAPHNIPSGIKPFFGRFPMRRLHFAAFLLLCFARLLSGGLQLGRIEISSMPASDSDLDVVGEEEGRGGGSGKKRGLFQQSSCEGSDPPPKKCRVAASPSCDRFKGTTASPSPLRERSRSRSSRRRSSRRTNEKLDRILASSLGRKRKAICVDDDSDYSPRSSRKKDDRRRREKSASRRHERRLKLCSACDLPIEAGDEYRRSCLHKKCALDQRSLNQLFQRDKQVCCQYFNIFLFYFHLHHDHRHHLRKHNIVNHSSQSGGTNRRITNLSFVFSKLIIDNHSSPPGGTNTRIANL